MSEWYHEFVDRNYKPGPENLLCLFRLEPASGFTIEDAAGRVASESSVGTWTELTTMKPRIRKLMAKAYDIQGNLVKVAYPPAPSSTANTPQLPCSGGATTSVRKTVQNVRLED